MKVSNAKLIEYTELFYRDLCDQETWYDVAEDIKAMAVELLALREAK